uniref:Uncharacterized protein n=1 Tax=Anguilla anguilla TaxID=7936 RepID=A0A0E9UU52_ANGAN
MKIRRLLPFLLHYMVDSPCFLHVEEFYHCWMYQNYLGL